MYLKVKFKKKFSNLNGLKKFQTVLESGWIEKPIKPDPLSFIKGHDSQLMFSTYSFFCFL